MWTLGVGGVVFVKICGITSGADAEAAVGAGADALGFVFSTSSRQVTLVSARHIARSVPSAALTLGVFRGESPERIVEVVDAAGLRGAQLHGRETPEEVAWVAARVPTTVKAFTIDDPWFTHVDDYAVHAVLVDAPTPGAGRVFDWSLLDRARSGHRLIVAGGLTPVNVAEAIERVRPWGVDVSSGVEAAPGRKDPDKLQRFVRTAKSPAPPERRDP